VLTRIFGPDRDEVTGGWRKLHNEELHDLYPSPSIIRIIKRLEFLATDPEVPGSISDPNKVCEK
jgi:hypothetical protein